MQLNLIDFKPYRDGAQLDSPVIQTAIDELFSAGGGTLNIPAGDYKIGAIVLKSNITLNLEAGARLIASENYADFAAGESCVEAEESWHSMIFAKNAKNIAITGQGQLFGNADEYHAKEANEQGYFIPAKHRPRMVIFENCENVKMVDFTIEHAPMWTVHFVCCSDVFMDRVTIKNDLTLSNTDAIDIDSCRNVHISNCSVTAADDCVCIKTSQMPESLARPAENITVTNCNLTSKSCAVKIGTETYRDVRNFVVSNCTITNSNRAIGLISRDGGVLSNIIMKNIVIGTAHTSPCHWGKADPIHISTRYRDPAIKPGEVKNVIFSDIIASSEGAINLIGIEDTKIENVSFNNIMLTLKASEAKDRGYFDIRPPSSSINPTGKGIDNAFRVEESGQLHGVKSYEGGMPALYAEHVEGLAVDALKVKREGQADYWNRDDIVLKQTSQH